MPKHWKFQTTEQFTPPNTKYTQRNTKYMPQNAKHPIHPTKYNLPPTHPKAPNTNANPKIPNANTKIQNTKWDMIGKTNVCRNISLLSFALKQIAPGRHCQRHFVPVFLFLNNKMYCFYCKKVSFQSVVFWIWMFIFSFTPSGGKFSFLAVTISHLGPFTTVDYRYPNVGYIFEKHGTLF